MSKQLKPDTEALDAYFASFESIDVRPQTPSRLPTPSSRVSSSIRSTRGLYLEQLEAREVPSATVFGDASNNWDSALVWTPPSGSSEVVDVRLAPHSSGTVVDNANVNFGEGILIKVSTGTGAGMVLKDDALTSLDDAYNALHGTAANPLGTDHMNFNFVSRLTGAIAIRLKQLDLGHIAHGNVLIDGSNGRTTVPIPSNGVIPWNPTVGIDSIMLINVHNQGELNPVGLSGIDVQMYLPDTPVDIGTLTTQVAALTQQVSDAQTALTLAQATAMPPPAVNALPWPEGVNASAKILGKLNVHPGQNLYAMHFSPDGNKFVTAGQDKVAKIWNASTGALLHTLSGNNSLVMDAVWSADGQSVWTTGYDKHVRQYSASTGAVLWDSGDLGSLVLSAAMSSDGANLTVSMHGMAPKVINTQTKAVDALGSGLIWTGNMTAMSDANVLMYVNTNAYRSGNYALIVNPATRQTVWQSNVMGGQLNAIAATPDGQWVIAGDDAGGLAVWKRSTNQQMFTLPNQGGVITNIATSEDGNQLFVGSGSQITAFDLRPLTTNQAPTLLHTYVGIGTGPRGMSVQGKNVTVISGDNGASRLVAVDRSGLSGYEDPNLGVNTARTTVSTLTAQLNTAQRQLDVLNAQEQQRNAVVAVLTQAGAMAEAEATVADLTDRMHALETWTLAGKADRLHALADRGAALTQGAADVRDELAMLEAQLSSDPAFYGALQDQAQQHVATLFGLSEQWSALQAEFDAVDWTKLSPKTLERLFPGSVEQSQTTFSVVQTSGNTVTLAIGGAGPMSVALQHGDAYLGSRTINTMANPPAFQTVTLMLDRTTASGPQTVNLLNATGTVISTVTLNWNKDTNTLSVADNANLFTPQGMAKDDGTLTYQQLFEQAETEELAQMTQAQNAITQQGLVSQINSAIITNNLISNNNGVMTSFVQLQNEQLLYLVCNTMGAPYDFAVSEAKFTASFYAAFPQWKEENRQQTMASYHLNWTNFDYYREAERNGWHQKIYPFNMTAASIIAASMDAALAIRRGQDPTSYIAQANSLSSGGGPLAAMGIQLPTANAALQACEAYLEQHASEFLEFQAPYVSQINQLWQSYSTGNSWAGGGTGSLSANQQAEANLTHQHNLAVILASTGTGSAIDRAAGYVLANPASKAAVAQLPTAQQAAINAAVVVLKNGGTAAKDGGLGKLVEAKEKLADSNFELASLTLHAAAGVNFTEGIVSPSSISWMHGVDASGGTTSHTFTIASPLLLKGTFLSQTGIQASQMQLIDSRGSVVLNMMANSALPMSVKQTLLPGTYTLRFVTPRVSSTNVPANAQFGLQADLLTTQTNDIEGTVQLGAKAMPVSLRVAEFAVNGQRKADYETTNVVNRISTLDPTKPVWVVIHGRTDKEDGNNIAELARMLGRTGQVVTLDWREMAKANSLPISLDGSAWIDSVASWAATQLKGLGFSPDQINLAGHSWGTYVSNSIAMKLGHVNTLIALDPASNSYASGLLGNQYKTETVDFAKYSNHSLAIYSSAFGSEQLAKTANKTITLAYPANYEGMPTSLTPGQMSYDALADAYREHGFAVTAFSAMLEQAVTQPSSAAAALLPLQQFLTTTSQANDTIHSNHTLSTTPYFDGPKDWWKTYPNMNQLPTGSW